VLQIGGGRTEMPGFLVDLEETMMSHST
jgi:hypothetical protein